MSVDYVAEDLTGYNSRTHEPSRDGKPVVQGLSPFSQRRRGALRLKRKETRQRELQPEGCAEALQMTRGGFGRRTDGRTDGIYERTKLVWEGGAKVSDYKDKDHFRTKIAE